MYRYEAHELIRIEIQFPYRHIHGRGGLGHVQELEFYSIIFPLFVELLVYLPFQYLNGPRIIRLQILPKRPLISDGTTILGRLKYSRMREECLYLEYKSSGA